MRTLSNLCNMIPVLRPAMFVGLRIARNTCANVTDYMVISKNRSRKARNRSLRLVHRKTPEVAAQ